MLHIVFYTDTLPSGEGELPTTTTVYFSCCCHRNSQAARAPILSMSTSLCHSLYLTVLYLHRGREQYCWNICPRKMFVNESLFFFYIYADVVVCVFVVEKLVTQPRVFTVVHTSTHNSSLRGCWHVVIETEVSGGFFLNVYIDSVSCATCRTTTCKSFLSHSIIWRPSHANEGQLLMLW